MFNECIEKYKKRLLEIKKFNDNELDFILKAYKFAFKAHLNQERKSGDPFITHPIETSLILAKWDLDYITVSAGLLHDVVEDTSITIDDIKKEFGESLAVIVDGVTKKFNIDSSIFGTGKFYKEKQEAKKENIYSDIDEMLSDTLKNEEQE